MAAFQLTRLVNLKDSLFGNLSFFRFLRSLFPSLASRLLAVLLVLIFTLGLILVVVLVQTLELIIIKIDTENILTLLE